MNSFTLDDDNIEDTRVVSQVNPGDGLELIVDAISSETPSIQEHVIEAHNQEVLSGPRDNEGTVFDATIHSTGADGKGKLTAKGVWAKRRGSKGKNAGAQSFVGDAGRSESRATTQDTKEKLAAKAAGIALAQMTFLTGQIIGGEEWAPIKRADLGMDETQMLTDAYTAYCEAKSITDIPPGIALSFALLAYAGPRFAMPKTQSRFRAIKEWFGVKYIGWKARRAERKRMKMDAQ